MLIISSVPVAIFPRACPNCKNAPSGTTRINFRANGAAITFLQELHYYPFGMIMEGIGTAKVADNAYKYNGKELNEDLGLNLSDYGARWYDAALGRWWSVDPLGEKQSN